MCCRECCVLSGRGLCDELITHPEQSYWLWYVVMCDLETSWLRRPWPTGGCRTKNKHEGSTGCFHLQLAFSIDTSNEVYAVTIMNWLKRTSEYKQYHRWSNLSLCCRRTWFFCFVRVTALASIWTIGLRHSYQFGASGTHAEFFVHNSKMSTWKVASAC